MSQMQLSEEMLDDVQKAITAHDERAADPGIAIQYMAALMGFMLATKDFGVPNAEILGQLCEFAHQVVQDIEAQGQQSPPEEESMGIWKPE